MHYIRTMKEPITNIDDAYEFFYNSGLSITMRLKKEITPETKLSDELDRMKILIPSNHLNNQ